MQCVGKCYWSEVSEMVLQDPSSQLAQDLVLVERRNLKQETVTRDDHWVKHMQKWRIFAEDPTCRKCGQQEETADNLMFNYEDLTRVSCTAII